MVICVFTSERSGCEKTRDDEINSRLVDERVTIVDCHSF